MFDFVGVSIVSFGFCYSAVKVKSGGYFVYHTIGCRWSGGYVVFHRLAHILLPKSGGRILISGFVGVLQSLVRALLVFDFLVVLS